MPLSTEILHSFSPISLKEMDAVKLQNRTDTKFMITRSDLDKVLNTLTDHYRVLEAAGTRSASYKTLYFDTVDHQLYLDHHNERPRRFKVRMRNYVESQLCFLEVKKKRDGRTIKSRIKINAISEELSEEQLKYVREETQFSSSLQASLYNAFSRTTLVNRNFPERVTIDTDLQFQLPGKDTWKRLDDVVIIEVKQDNLNRNSPLMEELKRRGIRPFSISKYCLGSLLLQPELKYNNFKEKILKVKKLQNAA